MKSTDYVNVLKIISLLIVFDSISGSRNHLIWRRECEKMATDLGDCGSSRQPTVKISIEHYVPETRYSIDARQVQQVEIQGTSTADGGGFVMKENPFS